MADTRVPIQHELASPTTARTASSAARRPKGPTAFSLPAESSVEAIAIPMGLPAIGSAIVARSQRAPVGVFDRVAGVGSKYYRRAIESRDEADRTIALAAARAIARQFPRDRLAYQAVDLLSQ